MSNTSQRLLQTDQIEDSANNLLSVLLPAIYTQANMAAGGGANVVSTFANGTIIVANANINFNNTATINVSGTANGTGQVNVAFSVNLTGSAITSAYAQANNAYIAANSSSGAVAYGQANLAYTAANTGQTASNVANTQANNAYVAANNAYIQANVANAQANLAYAAANLALVNIGSGTIVTSNAFTALANQTVFVVGANVANAALIIVSRNGLVQVPGTDYTLTGNNIITLTSNCTVNDLVEARLFYALSSNGVATILANDTLVLNGFINFNNTATVNISAVANGTYETNVAFTVNTSAVIAPAYAQANAAYGQANLGYAAANSALSNSLIAITTSTYPANVSNTVVVADANLTVTITNTGVYSLDSYLVMYGNNSNGVAGFQMDLGGGNATVNNILWSISGFGATAATDTALSVNNMATSAQTFPVIVGAPSTFIGKASWMKINGIVTINSAGTFGVRWAQNTASLNGVFMVANSFIKLAKIG